MGWTNPGVIAAIVGGRGLLALFVWIERHAADPCFGWDLFRIRMFSTGQSESLSARLAQGRLQFMW